jgi:hypothetical protein
MLSERPETVKETRLELKRRFALDEQTAQLKETSRAKFKK